MGGPVIVSRLPTSYIQARCEKTLEDRDVALEVLAQEVSALALTTSGICVRLMTRRSKHI